MYDLLRFTARVYSLQAAVGIGVAFRGSWRRFWYMMGTEGVFGFRVPWPFGGGGSEGWRTGKVYVEEYMVCERW